MTFGVGRTDIYYEDGAALHEAGHCIAALAYGARVKSVSLTKTDIDWISVDVMPRKQRVLAMAVIAWSGSIAGRGMTSESSRLSTADASCLREAGRLAGRPPFNSEWQDVAERFVNDHYAVIRHLAEALFVCRRLDSEQIKLLVKVD